MEAEQPGPLHKLEITDIFFTASKKMQKANTF
jgi:hypothetical protein